jgi:hypothetical protein
LYLEYEDIYKLHKKYAIAHIGAKVTHLYAISHKILHRLLIALKCAIGHLYAIACAT